MAFGLRGFEALLRLGHLADSGFQIILCQLLRRLLRRLLRFGDGLGLRLGFGLLTERGGNLLLLLLEGLLQASGLVQLCQRLIHLLLRGGDGFGSLGELRGVVRRRLAEFVGELLLLLVHGGLGGLEVGHRLRLVGTRGGGIGLFQIGLGGSHVFLRGVEGAGGFGGELLCVGLGSFGLRGNVTLLLRGLRGGLVVGLLGGLGGVRRNLLLLLHNLPDFLAELIKLGEVLLGLLQLGDLGIELLHGFVERVLRGLLGHRGVGLVFEGLLGLLLLARGFAEGLGGVGRVGGGVLLRLLRLGLHGLLLLGLLGEQFRFFLGGGGLLGLRSVFLHLLLLGGEFLDLLLQLFQISELVLGLLLLGLGDGDLLFQGLLGLGHLGEGLLLFFRRDWLVLRRALGRWILQLRAGFLLFLDGGLEFLSGLRRGLLHVLADGIGFVHDLSLFLLGLGHFGLLGFGLGGLLGFLFDFLLLGDGLLQIAHRLLHHLEIVARGLEQLGEVLEHVARALLVAGGGKQVGGFQVARGRHQRGGEAGILGLRQRGAWALGGGAVHRGDDLRELREHNLRLVADGALLRLLKLERDHVRGLSAAGVAALGQGGEADDFLEILTLTAGELREPGGDFLQNLLALIFEEQRAELDGDALLTGEGVERVASGGVGIDAGAGLLEEADHAGDFLLSQLVEHAADGAEHDHVVAFEAVALVFLDDRAELHADALGGGLDLLLPELLLEQLVATRREVGAGGGGGQGDGGNRQREEGFAVHGLDKVRRTFNTTHRNNGTESRRGREAVGFNLFGSKSFALAP